MIYFVHYIAKDKDGNQVLGNFDIELGNKIESIDDIRFIQKFIKDKRNYIDCIVANYQLLKEESMARGE